MALSWDIAKCKDTEIIKSESEWYKTEAIIFSTMAIDMHEITESNADDFYARLKVLSLIHGGLFYTAGIGWQEPTVKDVLQRIGLHTNAYTNNTFTQWLKRVVNVNPEWSKDSMLAAYYSAKVEYKTTTERISA